MAVKRLVCLMMGQMVAASRLVSDVHSLVAHCPREEAGCDTGLPAPVKSVTQSQQTSFC